MTPANIVIKVDTNGKWTELINDPSGQKTIFLANLEGDFFSKVRLSAKGHPLYHQR